MKRMAGIISEGYVESYRKNRRDIDKALYSLYKDIRSNGNLEKTDMKDVTKYFEQLDSILRYIDGRVIG